MIIKTLAKLCALGAIPCLLGFPLAVLAYRLQWWPMGQSFNLILITFFTSLALLVLAMLIAVFALFRNDLDSLKFSTIAFVLLAIPSVALAFQAVKGKSLPRIHDITTDTGNPPQFHAVLPLRGEESNSLDYAGEEIAQQQNRAYPYIQPINTSLDSSQAFQTALYIAGELGWELVAQDSSAGRIEAVDTTFLWGFKDDVVIRVQATEDGSRIDLRSVSRVGLSDLGANAERIKRFIDTFHNG